MCFLPEGRAALTLCFAFEQFHSAGLWKCIRHRHVVQILLVAHTCIGYLCMKFHCWKVLLLYLPKRRAQSHREKKSEWRSHREPERGREFVREHLSVVWWWLFSSKLSANWALPAFWVHVAIFVLESKAHVMNYNRFKELSRNKRGLVRGEEVRRRNLRLCGGRKRSETNRGIEKTAVKLLSLWCEWEQKARLLTLQAGLKYHWATWIKSTWTFGWN